MPGTDPGRRRTAAVLLPALLATSVIAVDPVDAQVMDDELFTLLLIDQLEYRLQDGDDLLAWEGEGRIGNDVNKAALVEQLDLRALDLVGLDQVLALALDHA